ncbi:MAG: ypdA 1 [Clostridia bacterium]|jgi:sensor histidine kinase YesM|nr:ypdA 1 [Clostridia bacterium]
MTIKNQFFITIILITIIPFVIVPLLGYTYIRDNIKNQFITQSKQELDLITKDIESVLNDLISASNIISLDKDIIEKLESGEKSVWQKNEVTNKLSRVNAAYLYKYNANINIYTDKGNTYVTTAQSDDIQLHPYKGDWIKETLKDKGYFNWKGFIDDKETSLEPVIGMGRALLDASGRTIGVLTIELFEDRYLKNLLFHSNELLSTERYLIDKYGNVIIAYSNNKEKILYSKDWFAENEDIIEDMQELVYDINGKKSIVITESISKSNWRVIQIMSYDELFSKLIHYRNFVISINLVFLGIIIILDIYSANKLTSSITKLSRGMAAVKQGKFITVDLPKKANKEIRLLAQDFNTMSHDLEALFNENRIITKEKEKSKLQALQAQIQPHFLFNTLNGIKWLSRLEGAPTAEKMITSLGHILEYSLCKNREIITLQEEITCLEHYVELQKMRYGNIFEVHFEIEEGLRSLEVPVLFLQPLVENSIIHGFQDTEAQGYIRIKAYKKGHFIHIEIEDNGCGMSQERINKVLESSNKKDGGIGVLNVKERIQLYYGKESDLHIKSREGEGTSMTLIFLDKRGKLDETNRC